MISKNNFQGFVTNCHNVFFEIARISVGKRSHRSCGTKKNRLYEFALIFYPFLQKIEKSNRFLVDFAYGQIAHCLFMGENYGRHYACFGKKIQIGKVVAILL